jgi:hypothetical protein
MRRTPNRSNGGSEVEGGVDRRAESCSTKLTRCRVQRTGNARAPTLVCAAGAADCLPVKTLAGASPNGQHSAACEASTLVKATPAHLLSASVLTDIQNDTQATNPQTKHKGKSIAKSCVEDVRPENIQNIICIRRTFCYVRSRDYLRTFRNRY